VTGTLTNRDIRRAFGPEAMQVIADLQVKVSRLEVSVAGLLMREQANHSRQLQAEIDEHQRIGESTL
jgi:hypothetical protein